MPDKRSRTSPANGAKSRGPVTIAGKQVSRANARTHGILSRELLLPTEDPVEFQQLLEELITDLKPSGTLEFTLVERMAMTLWRQRRFARAERAQILMAQALEGDGDNGFSSPAAHRVRHGEQGYGQIEPLLAELRALAATPSASMMQWEAFARAYPLSTGLLFQTLDFMTPEDWVEARNGSLMDLLPELHVWISNQYHELMQQVPRALSCDLRVIPAETDKLARYQSSLDNELYKAMRALRQAQAWRRDMLVPDE